MPKPKPTPTLNMNPAEWWWYSGPNMAAPYAYSAGWWFGFVAPPGYAGYLLHQHGAPVTASSLVVGAEIVHSGTPVFDYWSSEPLNQQGAGDPASASAVIWSKTTGRRFWSNERIWLGNVGQSTLTIPLTAPNWFSSDPGTTTLADALAAPWAIGLCFGGGSFRGHGVAVTGGAASLFCNEFRLA